MTGIDFTPFPKIARLKRDIVITEKIDGTNAAIVIVPVEQFDEFFPGGAILPGLNELGATAIAAGTHFVFAQSRTRFITPTSDNYGFAAWVERNAENLLVDLGAGVHFGEWWGSGIQRKYGLSGGDKIFSLFNASRWADVSFETPNLEVVPKLYEGPYDQRAIDLALELLRSQGSLAAPGFERPEGIVVFHTASRDLFKVTLEGDEKPKGPAGHKLDEEAAR